MARHGTTATDDRRGSTGHCHRAWNPYTGAFPRRGGGTGRRAGFKIRFLYGSVGSIPTLGTIQTNTFYTRGKKAIYITQITTGSRWDAAGKTVITDSQTIDNLPAP